MQYVALVECLKLVRSLGAKVGAAAMAASSPREGGEAGAPAMGRRAVKSMEEFADALGALEALLSEGAGDTSASGEAAGTLLSVYA